MNCKEKIKIKDSVLEETIELSCILDDEHTCPHTSKILLSDGDFIVKEHPHWVSFNWENIIK